MRKENPLTDICHITYLKKFINMQQEIGFNQY